LERDRQASRFLAISLQIIHIVDDLQGWLPAGQRKLFEMLPRLRPLLG